MWTALRERDYFVNKRKSHTMIAARSAIAPTNPKV